VTLADALWPALSVAVAVIVLAPLANATLVLQEPFEPTLTA
jgi:hypothetical protein